MPFQLGDCVFCPEQVLLKNQFQLFILSFLTYQLLSGTIINTKLETCTIGLKENCTINTLPMQFLLQYILQCSRGSRINRHFILFYIQHNFIMFLIYISVLWSISLLIRISKINYITTIIRKSIKNIDKQPRIHHSGSRDLCPSPAHPHMPRSRRLRPKPFRFHKKIDTGPKSTTLTDRNASYSYQ